MKIGAVNVTFSYGTKEVLKGISFEAHESEVLSIIGPNGSGKSTLIKCIDGLLKNNSGDIYLNGENIKNIPLKERAKFIAYVPQSSYEAFPQKVFETVLMGRKPHLGWSVGRKDLKVVENILEYMELSEISNSYLDELSGGQKQKVLIARALAQEPSILLLDEPTSSLDIKHQFEVLNIIKNISRRRKTLVIMVIHDLNMASRFSDELLLLKDGKIFSSGKADTVLTKDNIKSVYEIEVSAVNIKNYTCFIPTKIVDQKIQRRNEIII